MPPDKSSTISNDSSLECYHDSIPLRPVPVRRGGRSPVLALWGKGGAAKTTTAWQFAAIAASLGGRVAILDLDPQGSSAEWSSLRGEDDRIIVQTGRPSQVGDLVRRASTACDLVLIDNPPDWAGLNWQGRDVVDMSLVVARASILDLQAALRWVEILRQAGALFVVALTAAPALRRDMQSPLVRFARQKLVQAGGAVWRGQVSARHAIIKTTAEGRTLIEAEPHSPGTREYCRLWNAVIGQLAKEYASS